MVTLYQAEWCPHSRRVRQRLTELGVTVTAVPVPAERADREEMRRKVGTDEIPALLLEDGTAVAGEADDIIGWLNEHFTERLDAGAHRRQAEEHGAA
jgi:glutathione S-transferase